MKDEITENNFNRLAICIMTKHRCSYQEAMDKLCELKLNLVCGSAIGNSIPLQAALLTAVNTGKRAFLGGIFITIPEDVNTLIPWPNSTYLNDIIVELGGQIVQQPVDGVFSLKFGLSASIDENSLEVVCNSWQGGFSNGDSDIRLLESNNIPLGGIAAGALGVGTAFLRLTNIQVSAGDVSTGISLWRPDLGWLDDEANGPEVIFLPEKFWLLGLGHLGQAYLWNIAFLPYPDSSQISVLLQDYDKMSEANLSAGLICEEENDKQYKTRICSNWLEERGFKTIISERKFDESTKCNSSEPLIALCGFDSAVSRLHLEDAGFDLIVEAALGGNLSLFDNIILHTFPNASKSPKVIWGNLNSTDQEINSVVLEKFSHLKENECGIIAQNLASKAISTAFVGALAGALAIAELLRALNGGKRYDLIVAQVRSLQYKNASIHKNESYSSEMARNGFVSSKC
jgi:hypothetical protein